MNNQHIRKARAARHIVQGPTPPPPETFELLERRALLSFSFENAPDAFHLERLIRDVGVGEGNFGAVVASIGDIDDDGLSDFAVAAPGSRGVDGRWGGLNGSVFVYSGASRTLVRTLSDGAAGFGSAMVSMGDVDGDGVPDLAVGSPSADVNADATQDYFGRVAVYSGADGSVIWSRQGGGRLDELGWALALAGDVDGDDVTDLAIGAPGAGLAGAGTLQIVSGVDGASIATYDGEAPGDRFGHAVDAGVDAPLSGDEEEGDGFFELLVGAPGNSAGGANAGRAYLIDGFDASFRHTFTGNAGDELGASVLFAGAGTIHPGALIRFTIGLPGSVGQSGSVRQYTTNGFLENTIASPAAGSRFGSEMRRLDVRESSSWAQFYTISAPGAAEQRLTLYPRDPSGSSWVESRHIRGASSIAAMNDADGDGIWDVIAGFADPVDSAGAGSAKLMPVTLMATSLWEPDVAAASDNGMNFVVGYRADLAYPFLDMVEQGYVVRNAELTPTAAFPGLAPGAQLVGVNNAGLFIGVRREANAPFTPSDWFFLYNGQSVALEDAITHVDGRAPMELSFVKMNNAGDVLFKGSISGVGPRGFLFRGGVLRELPGEALDINDAGTVLSSNAAGPGPALLIDGAGVVTPVVGLDGAGRVNDGNVVFGVVLLDVNDSLQPQLAMWDNGEVTILSEGIVPPEGAFPNSWRVVDIDDAGRIVARFEWSFPSPGRPGGGNPGTNFLYSPEGGFQDLRDVTENEGNVFEFHVNNATLLDTGAIVYDGSTLLPIGAPPGSGHQITNAHAGPNGVYVSSINQAGEVVVLRRDGVRTFSGVLDVNVLLGSVDSVVTYADTRDGLTYAVARTSLDRLIWFKQQSDGFFGDGVMLDLEDVEPIASPLTTFTSIDGRVHIAGVTESGRVVIYYQTNQAAPDSLDNWQYDNLGLEHLEANGSQTPEFDAGTELVPYVTPWGGMNLAGLNADGVIEVVWWAPGKIYWDYDNLSEQAGTPTLQGQLVSFVGSWGGLHLGGIDEEGHLVSTWWAPGLTSWAANDLTAEYSGMLLDPASITSYVTSWNGLNIAGIDATTGEAAVYWWTPTTGAWITERLNLGDDAPHLTGRLESAVRENNLNIFGTTEDGRLVRLFWYPSQESSWVVEDMAASAATASLS